MSLIDALRERQVGAGQQVIRTREATRDCTRWLVQHPGATAAEAAERLQIGLSTATSVKITIDTLRNLGLLDEGQARNFWQSELS